MLASKVRERLTKYVSFALHKQTSWKSASKAGSRYMSGSKIMSLALQRIAGIRHPKYGCGI
jgi:hypothetical protein